MKSTICQARLRSNATERWNQEEFALAKGTPWEQIPERARIEVKSHFTMEDDDAVISAGPAVKESKPRRIYVTRSDIAKYKYGFTPGRKGYEAIN